MNSVGYLWMAEPACGDLPDPDVHRQMLFVSFGTPAMSQFGQERTVSELTAMSRALRKRLRRQTQG